MNQKNPAQPLVERRPGRIAIAGAAGRFPGARNLDEYWRLLRDATIVTRTPDPGRTALWDAMRDPVLADRLTTFTAGYLDEIDAFDADYFGISPREARKLDPQQRLMLTATHDALEDAGLTRAALADRRVGVFVGASSSDYMGIDAAGKRDIDAYHGVGNALSVIAARLSYFYDFSGPCLTIDTACSSSLTAVHYAVQALLAGDIDVAVVGGVNALLTADLTLSFSRAGMLSPDGRCHTFGAGANGYARAEAVGVAILQRVDEARRARCLIAGTAINQDGRSNGITAPNGRSQAAVIRAALDHAQLSPAAVGYIEAHGTGTTLGDAIEFEALAAVFGSTGDQPCYVGSAKANIGHGEAAAGICGLLKAMLVAESQIVPPHPVQRPWNPVVDRAAALHIAEVEQILAPGRYAVGVSSFGFGGSNAHVILERPPVVDHSEQADLAMAVMPVSSHARDLLAEDMLALAQHLATERPSLDSARAVLTSARDHHRFRRAWSVSSVDEFADKLRQAAADDAPAGPGHDDQPVHMAFVFTGQGSQGAAMGRDLYARSPRFRAAFDEIDEVVSSVSGLSVGQGLYGAEPWPDALLLSDTHRAQLALFVVELALARTWRSLGVIPDFVIGHSIGEIVAQAFVGGMALDDAAALVDARGALMQAERHDGAMLAVLGEPAALAAWLGGMQPPLFVAAFNSERSVVVAGDSAAVDQAVSSIADAGLTSRRLRTRHAFHTPFFTKAADELRAVVGDRRCDPSEIPVISNVDGRPIDVSLTADYWARHMIEPVRFDDGISALRRKGAKLFLEIGPGRTLTALLQRDLGQEGCAVASMSAQAPWHQFLAAAACLFEQGVDVRLDDLAAPSPPRGYRPPARALRRTKFWTDSMEADGRPAPVPVPVSLRRDLPERSSGASFQRAQNELIVAQLNVVDEQLRLLDRMTAKSAELQTQGP